MNSRRSDPRVARSWNPDPDTFALGAHLVFVRRTYEHHAFFTGNGLVLEYPDVGGIRETPFEEVRNNSRYWILADDERRHPALFTGPEALERARLRTGEALYNRAENNCEHLMNWALSGHHHCDQTDSGAVYVGLGFISWIIHRTHNEAWHRRRLIVAHPDAHRDAGTRYRHYRTLRDQGLTRVAAADATRQQFAVIAAQAA